MRSSVMTVLCALGMLCASSAVATEQGPTLEPSEITGLEEQLRALGLSPGQPMRMKTAPEGTQGPLVIGYAPNRSPGGQYPVFIVEVDVAPSLGMRVQSPECRVGMAGNFTLRESGEIYTGLRVEMNAACLPADPDESVSNKTAEILSRVFVKCLRFVSQTIRDDKSGVKAL